MNNIWYTNPKVLLEKPSDFYPTKNQSLSEKSNSLARFAIYCILLCLLLGFDNKWLSIPIVILIISLGFGQTENFSSAEFPSSNNQCQTPTYNNPFMNFTLGDLISNPLRKGACDYDKSKKLILDTFRSHLHADSFDIWGKNISDRNFYIMPNTNIVNGQFEFAQWCYGAHGECKYTGNNCLKNRDPLYHRGRMVNLDN